MYAIIRSGGKQYKVSKGDEIIIDQVAGNVGDKFDISDIIMIRDDHVSVDGMDKVKVIASIIEHFRGDKTIVYKHKPKKNYRRKFGHRSYLTRIKIEDIKVSKAKASKKTEVSEEAEATA